MQQSKREQQQRLSNVGLMRQLPADTIREKTPPVPSEQQKKVSKSAPSRFDSFTLDQQLLRAQTDLHEFDTHRSLSSCPTYSSLSRHSPETRECATQITTLPVHHSQRETRTHRSLSQLDHQELVLLNEIPIEEVELMPISSGFGYYPYNYPTTITQRSVGPGTNSPGTKETPIEKSRSPRVVRVVRERPHRDHEEVYYTEPEPPARVVYESAAPRRKAIVRRSSPGEFVYVDDAAGTPIVRRRERAPRSEVVYVDDEAPTEYIDEYVYLDENGKEIDVVHDQKPSSSQYVEYVYEDERDKRFSRPAKVVYVDNDGKEIKKPKKASSTKVIYD